MSTYIYLECRQHVPPLRAENESGQHLYDLPTLRQDIRDREVLVRLWQEEYGFPGYFRNNTARFLARHDGCPIGIVDEYGETYPIEVEGENK